MRLHSGVALTSLVLVLSLSVIAQDKLPQNNVRARELFYASLKVQKPAPKPEPIRPETKTPQSTAPKAATPGPRANAPAPSVSAEPLAVRYKVLKVNGRNFEAVDADRDFVSGDTIKVSVTVNDAAYVYIAQLGSSGAWKVLFPENGAAANANFVAAFSDIEIPPADNAFRFDKTTGTEQLFIAVSRKPIADLERVIRNGNTPAPAPPAAPPAQKSRPDLIAGKTLAPQFSATVVEAVMRTRDLNLVTYKDNPVSAGSQGHAIYMANGTNSQSPVVAEFKLKHK